MQWAHTRRLATDEIASIQAAYLAGATVYDLAAEQVHRHTIATHLKAVGVPMRGRPLSEAQIEAAARLYESGLSLARVGERVSATARTVQLRLRERGVQMRDTHGQVR